MSAISVFLIARIREQRAVAEAALLDRMGATTDEQRAKVKGTFAYQSLGLHYAVRELGVALAGTAQRLNRRWLLQQAAPFAAHPDYVAAVDDLSGLGMANGGSE